jgi:hypothetical protein
VTKFLKNILVSLLVVSVSALAFPTQAHAQTQAWSGVCVADINGYGTGDVASIQGLQCLIANLFTVGLTIIGLAGFVVMIVASLRYLLSGGNTKGIDTARSSITNAVIGLIVALSAFIVINLISAFTGVSLIKNFVIPNSDSVFN